eukprot:scaffold2186_cov113-Cylindrotheca_fusiformis.AAC.2
MGNSFSSAAAGFFWGSVVTGVTSFIYFSSAKGPKIDEFKLALQKSKSRGAHLEDSENVNFLTDLIARLWPNLSPAIGETIIATVEPMFKDMLPGPLASMHFTKCDLGHVPMRLDNIVVHPRKKDTINFDVDVIWDGSCDIRLKGGMGVTLGVQNIKLLGRMQFLMRPLSNELPCLGAIQYSFINPPSLVLDFTGLGNVADVGGVDQTIRGIIKDAIAGVMVLPNRLAYKMDLACDYRDAFVPPVGIVRLTAVGGRGFQIEKGIGFQKDDIPDVYLKIKFGGKLWTTTVVKDNLSPEWNETADFVLSDTDQIIKVDAWDEDSGTFDSDDFLGTASLTIADMLLKGKTMEAELLDHNNVSTGAFVTLHCEICDLNSDPKSFAMPPAENHIGGLLTIIITNAFDLPITKEEAESFVKVKYGKHEFVTGCVVDYPGYDCLNPIYDISFLAPLTAEVVKAGPPDVSFELMNKWAKPTLLGALTVSHKELMEAPEHIIKEKRPIGSGGASLEFQVSIQGVGEAVPFDPSSMSVRSVAWELSGETSDRAADLADEISQVKVTIVSGQGFKIKKKTFKKDDIPDVYCNVKFGSSPSIWRTSTIKDSVTPAWNESQIYTFTSEKQVITVDAMDANSKSEDTPLGGFRVSLGKVLLNGGKMELELQNEGVGKAAYITVACELISDKKAK